MSDYTEAEVEALAHLLVNPGGNEWALGPAAAEAVLAGGYVPPERVRTHAGSDGKFYNHDTYSCRACFRILQEYDNGETAAAQRDELRAKLDRVREALLQGGQTASIRARGALEILDGAS